MISVIIPALNEEENIESCLKSLQNQDFSKPYEIILMDNGSDDKTRERGRDYCDRLYKKPDLQLYELRNKGIELAKGDKIALLDADCIAYSDWLKEADKSLRKADMVTGSLKPLENSSFYGFGFWVFSDLFLTYGVNYFGLSNALGGNCAFKKEKAMKIGGFKETFPSDGTFGFEMARVGKTYHNPDMKVKTSIRRYKNDSILNISREMIISHIKLRAGIAKKSTSESEYWES